MTSHAAELPVTTPPSAPGERTRHLARVRSWATELRAGLSLPVVIVYLALGALNIGVFTHGDLHWTINNAYAYLSGHVFDFYDYNLITSGEASYYPTVYVLFALALVPMKLLFGHDAQPGGYASAWDLAWIKALLVLTFWASAIVLSRITRELFPAAPRTRSTIQAAYLLSPYVAFAIGIFGQYDIIGTLFTLLGFLYFLRGDRWKFAIFFGIAATCKFFPLAVFVPLLLIRYKRPKDILQLGLTTAAVVVVAALPYLGSPAFRERTLIGLAAGMTTGSAEQSGVVTLVGILLAVGFVVLWRTRFPEYAIGPAAVFASATSYGLMLAAVAWHPQWFLILAPFYALALGYLRHPRILLVAESLVFLAFVWFVVNRMPGNVDANMVQSGSLRTLIDGPNLLMGAVFRAEAMPALGALLTLFLVAPVAVLAAQQGWRRGLPADHPTVPTSVWMLRALTAPLLFSLPALLVTFAPLDVARRLDPAAGTYAAVKETACASTGVPYGEIADGTVAVQTFTTSRPGLRSLSLLVGTYGRPTEGQLVLELREASGDVIGRSRTALGGYPDGSRAFLHLEEALEQPGTYTIDASTRGVASGAGIALWGSGEDCITAGELEIDSPAPGDLDLVLYYE